MRRFVSVPKIKRFGSLYRRFYSYSIGNKPSPRYNVKFRFKSFSVPQYIQLSLF